MKFGEIAALGYSVISDNIICKQIKCW